MKEPEYRAMFDAEDSHWWFVARRLFLSKVLRDLPQTRKKIADIGAGTGGMIGFLKQYGDVIGIEPNATGRAFAKRRGIVLRSGDAEHTNLTRESVDMVCFFDVLYHRGIQDIKALAEAKRILRPGGLLVITDCAMPFLEGPHDRAVEGRERYTLSGFVRTIRRAGFRIEKQTYMYFLLFPVVLIKRLVDRFFTHDSEAHSDVTPVPSWIHRIASAINSIEAEGLRWFSYPWGSSLCIIARKPGGKV